MTRMLLDLTDRDITVVADALGTESDGLAAEMQRRPWFANDVLRHPEVVERVLGGAGGAAVDVSPLLFFAVMAHAVADELGDAEWVADWTGPRSRLPVFDVEPLVEFTDAPARLAFVAQLLAEFAAPSPLPLPSSRYDLDDLVDWLDAAEPHDRVALLRRLGDVALFRAGVFPDATGPLPMSSSQAEHLGHSVGMTDEEIAELVDPASATPGLDALETLGSAWYMAAADEQHRSPTILRDIAARVRPARRFLNRLADQYLQGVTPGWVVGS